MDANAPFPLPSTLSMLFAFLYYHLAKKNQPLFHRRSRRNFLAGEDRGAGDLVVGDRGPVDADLDTGVGALHIRVSNQLAGNKVMIYQGKNLQSKHRGRQRWRGSCCRYRRQC